MLVWDDQQGDLRCIKTMQVLVFYYWSKNANTGLFCICRNKQVQRTWVHSLCCRIFNNNGGPTPSCLARMLSLECADADFYVE